VSFLENLVKKPTRKDSGFRRELLFCALENRTFIYLSSPAAMA